MKKRILTKKKKMFEGKIAVILIGAILIFSIFIWITTGAIKSQKGIEDFNSKHINTETRN